MIITANSQTLAFSKLTIGGLSASSPGTKTADGKDSSTIVPVSKPQNSIFENFNREMTKRLDQKQKGEDAQSPSSPSVLAQSLTGAMGEIEEIFGREAAIEVMSLILTETEDDLTLGSLLNSL
jgi:hypothetical protein